jgi:predicted CXXCH cytochrome family protein
VKSLYKVLLPAVLMISGSALAAGVADTKHNLAGAGGTGDNGQMCVYCHAPHTASVNTSPPLWNRNASTASYQVYSSATIDMTIGNPGAESTVCLSCHDGTVALDSIINTPEAGWTQGGTRTMASTAPGYVGTDLRSEHPVGVTYDITSATGDPAFDSIANATTDGIVFFGGGTNVVECASCHAVHDYTNVPFLRLANTNSALCLACHLK